ncbi:aminoglycoside phosphotransferase family protein [Streptomonospora nanhaiensis]|uniref:Streptomycin 6-kinase n=1 Tax=Streptomonospora nanhaiensis TaxID=1323731 RepID=A0A853BLY1_9ACTN|nr:aminoglycoside phosphotransferase family protein [Streptomonospora nanhaiensis]MBV2364760.1 aminoglycoside phosphotransferase family protein [Streptomonospora nanhaiensis]MBV2366726.1 aminoglycoside phosphotransferase family protein [Streptomonospora nanhaiensis]MBX9390995.1 aminoglycoside phosphotransferase family protein [Streptomonospora nanhaiensis]NYI96000.1 streptomycin 6-kinase [Streptomonospora nanhaiensis]
MSEVTARYVDDKQRRRLIRRFGRGAADWLDGLPARVDELAAEWKLSVEGPAPHGRTSVVLFCRRLDGGPAILKISPDPGLGTFEARLLRLWEESGRVPAVWEVDTDRGAVLLERIGEGRTVALEGEVPPMHDVADLIAELHAVDVPHDEMGELHPLHSRMNFLYDMWEHERQDGPAAELVPTSVLHRGHARARDLAHGEDDVVPLHGDLHPGNVLLGGPERGLVAVDPRACVGDAAVDAVDWAIWQADSLEEVERRVALLSSRLEVPGDRLLAWCRACAPLFAVAAANRGRADTPHFAMLMALADS